MLPSAQSLLGTSGYFEIYFIKLYKEAGMTLARAFIERARLTKEYEKIIFFN